MPAFTPQAQERQAALRQFQQSRGPADSYTDRSNYDRCITRGLSGSVLPVIYNNGTQIFQSPGYVTIVNEMIHETRVVPLDGRPHVSSDIKMWLGDSRGRFEGDTLVVETTNFTDRTGVGVNGGGQRHSEALKITERFTRVADDSIDYQMTIDDPQTWTAPWTMQFPRRRRLRDVRVRMPRGQSRDVPHLERRSRRRARGRRLSVEMTAALRAVMLLVGVLGILPASAHHSWARYDADHVITVEGNITSIEWASPHVVAHFTVAAGSGESVAWTMEMDPPRCWPLHLARHAESRHE